MDKLNKVMTEKIINLPFQKDKFIQWLIFSIIIAPLCFYLSQLSIRIISGTSLLLLIGIYFIPTFIAYDFFSLYNEDQNIPQLKNPKRIVVLLINIILGFTVIGWVIALYVAFNPGITRVTIVEYKAESSKDG